MASKIVASLILLFTLSRATPLLNSRPNFSTMPYNLKTADYTTIIRPTNQLTQRVVEVSFNNITRYLLMDTGSADTWMTASDYVCWNATQNVTAISDCRLGEPYTGGPIPQIGNESYVQVYGTTEIVNGTFGYADVEVAGPKVANQKVALVQEGFIAGDNVRSGVFGLARGALGALYENTNPENTWINDGAKKTPYRTVVEGMYSNDSADPIAPVFSTALQRGEDGGYLSFGGLPPVDFSHDFTFTPFTAINSTEGIDPTRYYPIQPDGFELNGIFNTTDYRVAVDSGTGISRLPTAIADPINAAFDPPAAPDSTLDPTGQFYFTDCNATIPSFSFCIGPKTFVSNMLLQYITQGGRCATGFTKGFSGEQFQQSMFPDGFYVLGDTFLNGVVAVFDIGNEGMWFATHDY